MTGQNFLAYHQSKIDIEVSKFCRLCEEEEETFTNCPRLETTRKHIFLDKPVNSDMAWSIRKILYFINTPTIFNMLTTKTDLPLKDVLYIDCTYSDEGSCEQICASIGIQPYKRF